MNEQNLPSDISESEHKVTEIGRSTEQAKIYKLVILGASIIGLAVIIGAIVIGGVVLVSGKLIVSKLNTLTKVNAPSGQVQQPAGPVEIKISESMPMLGEKDAPVTMVEFADYQCPFCGSFYSETFAKIKAEYIDAGKVKFYYQDFAFLGEESAFAAEAAKCAGQQGKYWEYHDYLYSNQDGENEGAFFPDNLKKIAGSLGLDPVKFNDCVDSRIFKPDVEAETQAGTSYGVNATPTVFINGVKYEGALSFEAYKQGIEAALKK